MALAVPALKNNGGVSKTAEELLENNISNTPLTVAQIQRFYDALDEDKKGHVSLDALREWYKSLDFMGTNPTEREIEFALHENIHTVPDGLTFDEFVIFILTISRWKSYSSLPSPKKREPAVSESEGQLGRISLPLDLFVSPRTVVYRVERGGPFDIHQNGVVSEGCGRFVNVPRADVSHSKGKKG
eukprot:gene8172-5701_t